MGEAVHPGPPNFRRLRLRASSVSEPGSTVPASSQAFQAVQRGGPAIVDMSQITTQLQVTTSGTLTQKASEVPLMWKKMMFRLSQLSKHLLWRRGSRQGQGHSHLLMQ